MRVYIVIPAYNEAKHISATLESLATQTYLPKKICVVNDNSTDTTSDILQRFTSEYDFISSCKTDFENRHLPGSKVVHTFQYGLATLDDNYDIICKFDADLIFPDNYIETIVKAFTSNPKLGMAGGFCYIQNAEEWVLENLTGPDHIRGALKAYRKECYKEIGGLIPAMGWDTLDELLALFYGWELKTLAELRVKHLKPTGQNYHKASRFHQGKAFYQMRYRWLLTFLAAAKLSVRRRSFPYFWYCMLGFIRAFIQREPFLVTKEQGRFIRSLRWKGISETYLKVGKS